MAKNQLQVSGLSPLVVFYVLAFAISWVGYIPAIAGSLGVASFQSSVWLGTLVLPGVGPALAAWIVSAHFAVSADGTDGPLTRLKKSFLTPVPFRWWALTVTLAAGVMIAASLLSVTVDQTRSVSRASLGSVLLFSLLSIMANPMEEIGWRGFAQRKLQRTNSALTAAIIVGFFWTIWHVPLFLLSKGPMSMAATPFVPWAAGVIPQAILLAWLYNRTGRSLATVSVFHILGNISSDILRPSATMIAVVRVSAALTVLLLAGPDLGNQSLRKRTCSACGYLATGSASRDFRPLLQAAYLDTGVVFHKAELRVPPLPVDT